MTMDNKHTAEQIVEALGGPKNVKGLTHCVTRLRFTLADDAIVSDDAVSAIDGVMGVAKASGQYGCANVFTVWACLT